MATRQEQPGGRDSDVGGDLRCGRIVGVAVPAPAIGCVVMLVAAAPLPPRMVSLGEGAYDPLIPKRAPMTRGRPRCRRVRRRSGQWLINLAPSLFTLVAMAVCATMLWRLIAAGRRGEPFTQQTLNAGRWLGVTLLTFALIAPFVRLLATAVLTTGMRNGEFNVAFTIDDSTWWALTLGLIVPLLVEAILGRATSWPGKPTGWSDDACRWGRPDPVPPR